MAGEAWGGTQEGPGPTVPLQVPLLPRLSAPARAGLHHSPDCVPRAPTTGLARVLEGGYLISQSVLGL